MGLLQYFSAVYDTVFATFMSLIILSVSLTINCACQEFKQGQPLRVARPLQLCELAKLYHYNLHTETSIPLVCTVYPPPPLSHLAFQASTPAWSTDVPEVQWLLCVVPIMCLLLWFSHITWIGSLVALIALKW